MAGDVSVGECPALLAVWGGVRLARGPTEGSSAPGTPVTVAWVVAAQANLLIVLLRCGAQHGHVLVQEEIARTEITSGHEIVAKERRVTSLDGPTVSLVAGPVLLLVLGTTVGHVTTATTPLGGGDTTHCTPPHTSLCCVYLLLLSSNIRSVGHTTSPPLTAASG